jgi:hypothetical protein
LDSIHTFQVDLQTTSDGIKKMCDNLIETYYTVLFATCDATTQFLKNYFLFMKIIQKKSLLKIYILLKTSFQEALVGDIEMVQFSHQRK